MSPASPKPVVVYVATTARKLLRLFRERIIEMKRQGFEVIVCSGVDASVYALEGLGAEHIALPVTEQPDPGRLAAAFVLLTSALIERNALMVHSHSLSLHLAAATAARIAGTPIAVATVHHHGDLTNPVSQLLGRGYFQLVGQAVDAYIVHHTREHETAAAYAPADKLHFIEAAVGVDMRRFVPASDEEVASARRRLGLDPARTYVATLYRRGWPPASLLDLIDRVHSTAPDLGWIVAGPDAAPAALEGPLRERVEFCNKIHSHIIKRYNYNQSGGVTDDSKA